MPSRATHPGTIERFESQIETVDMRDPGHDRLRHALLAAFHAAVANAAAFRRKIVAAGEEVEKLMSLAHVRIAPPVRNAEDAEFAVMCLAEEFARLEARRGAEAEIEEAMEDLTGLADEGLTWRLSRAAEARHRAERSKLDEISEQGEDRAALSAELQRLIDGAAWIKKKP
ncbi:MAG: hypothetical protein R3D61_09665 [Defluviimonas denitrificans]